MKRENPRKQWLLSVVALPILLIIWEIAAGQAWISPVFFPPPSKIWNALAELFLEGKLLPAVRVTIIRFGVGLTVGSVLGAALGLMMGWWPRLQEVLNPIISAIHPIPKIAIFPLLMIVFGLGESSKFVAILLAAFFPMLITSLSGVHQISQVYFEVGENYGARGIKVFQHILFPGSLPSLLAGLRLAANTAFVIAISVEIISANQGLGVLLWFGWQTFRVSDIYALLVVIALVGILINLSLERLSNLIIPWAGR